MGSIQATTLLATIVIAGWKGGSSQDLVLNFKIPSYCFQCDEEVEPRCRYATKKDKDIYKKCPPLRNETLTMFCRKIEYYYNPRIPMAQYPSTDEKVKIIRSCYEASSWDTYIGCYHSKDPDFYGFKVCDCDEKGCNGASVLTLSVLGLGLATLTTLASLV